MSKNYKNIAARVGTGYVEVKSKFDAEFRRISINKHAPMTFEEFLEKMVYIHGLGNVPITLWYTDPKDGDLLPINNDDNFHKAVETGKPLLRLQIQRKGELTEDINGYSSLLRKNKNKIGNIFTPSPKSKGAMKIGMPEDFRRVSAIIDVDIVPDTQRRVKLLKHGSDKPLGFYIRDGTSVRVTPNGLEKVPGIFISRLVPGGLAESTGLLAVNDEVLEVNGIEVAGKTLDQVTDMMVANSSNLIITVKPVNQRNTLSRRGSATRSSQMSAASSSQSATGSGEQVMHLEEEGEEDEDDEDVVKDYLGATAADSKPAPGHAEQTASNRHSGLEFLATPVGGGGSLPKKSHSANSRHYATSHGSGGKGAVSVSNSRGSKQRANTTPADSLLPTANGKGKLLLDKTSIYTL